MDASIDIHVHDIKKVLVERAHGKGLIRIHLIDDNGCDHTVLRIWASYTNWNSWPGVEIIDEKPEPITVEVEEANHEDQSARQAL